MLLMNYKCLEHPSFTDNFLVVCHDLLFLQPIRIYFPTPHSFLVHLRLLIHSFHLEYHLFVHFILAMYYPSSCLSSSLKSSFKHFSPEWFYNSEFPWSVFFFTYSVIYWQTGGILFTRISEELLFPGWAIRAKR